MADEAVVDEGVLDPRVIAHFEANPFHGQPLEDFSPEMLELARGPVGFPPTRDIAQITDDTVDGVPIRIYRNDDAPTGLVVYFHGGGHCIGSIGLMDNVARELTYVTGAVVVSVGYRLAPEHPYPAGLDDCEMVTRWAVAHAAELGSSPDRVVIAGESAGGNLAAAVALRLRASGGPRVAGQVLMYPSIDGASREHESRALFDGIVLSYATSEGFWSRYTGGRDLRHDGFAAPLQAESVADLPPAIVIVGGCDPLRDEGRAYARRLQDAGVPVEDICIPGQPHGFINFGVPAAADAMDAVGTWVRGRFA